MIAIQPNDRCLSIASSEHNIFNTDRFPRTEISDDLARSAFDFTIVKEKNYDKNGREIPGQFHLERTDDNSFIPSGSIGNQFVPIQHRDVFDYIVNEVRPHVPGITLEMAGTIHGGGVGLVMFKYGDTFAIPGDESENRMRLFFHNPTNGTGRMVTGFTTVRVVCENTYLAATREAGQNGGKTSHTQSAPERLTRIIASIRGQAEAALGMKRRSELLAGIGVDKRMLMDALDAVYPIDNLPEGHARSMLENLRDGVIRQFEAGETAQTMKRDSAWKLFNSFTYPIFNPDEKKLERSKHKDRAEIQYKGMGGTVADKVHKIFDAVERVAYAA